MVVAAPLATERRCEKALCYTVTVLRQVTSRARRNDWPLRDFLRRKMRFSSLHPYFPQARIYASAMKML
jgi:hypothetical protein